MSFLIPFLIVCLQCRTYEKTNIHFEKPNLVLLRCFNCGFQFSLKHNPKDKAVTRKDFKNLNQDKLNN